MAKKSNQYYLLNGFGLLELLIAIFLSSLISMVVFKLVLSAEKLNQDAKILCDIQDKMRFLSYFLRQKIEMAGNADCINKKNISLLPVLMGYDQNTAKEKLDINVKSGTALLAIQECVLNKNKSQYLPILFFIAKTQYLNLQNKPIYSLFYKIGDNNKEELISNMDQFNLLFKINNIYLPLSNNINWPLVKTVKIIYFLNQNKI